MKSQGRQVRTFTRYHIPKLLHSSLQVHMGSTAHGDLRGQRGYRRLGVLILALDLGQLLPKDGGLIPHIYGRWGGRG